MNSETYDLKNDLKKGKDVFENLPNDIRPFWAGIILSRFDSYIEEVPESIRDLYPIIDDKSKWKEAHKIFSGIRIFNLENKNYKPENYLSLAELVAKVIYNASGESAPFDSDSGHYISSLALKTVEYFDNERLEEEVKSAILLFNRNKKFKDNLTAAKGFLVYKKIDDILWFEWDPIGINDIFPRDEYQGYVPEIFRLVKTKAGREEIAMQLYQFETQKMGLNGNFENCLIVADRILRETQIT